MSGSGDYISREAAIKCCTFGRTSLGLIDELRRLPAADVRENVKGLWIFDALRNNHYCSKCRSPMHSIPNEDGAVEFTPYCYNRGAQMGGNDGERI